jgi:hypothetical protein
MGQIGQMRFIAVEYDLYDLYDLFDLFDQSIICFYFSQRLPTRIAAI